MNRSYAIEMLKLLGIRDVWCFFQESAFVFALLRLFLAVSCVALVRLSHTPYCWPTFVVSFVPLVLLWRGPLAPRSMVQLAVEAILIGYLMELTVARFVLTSAVSQHEKVMHSVGCLFFSLQILACGIALHITRLWSTILSAPLVAVIISVIERIEAESIGLTWVISNPQLAVAGTPIAQWSGLLTPFGISIAVYTINFLWLPRFTNHKKKSWGGTGLGFFSTAFLWLGGMALERSVEVRPLSFVVAIVQPHDLSGEQSWKQLNRLTARCIRNSGSVDLVVWPEGSLDGGNYDDCSNQLVSGGQSVHRGEAMPLDRFCADLQPEYRACCLVGADMCRQLERDDFQKFESLRVYNCGCLVETNGEIRYHEKQLLVPMREGIPNWLNSRIVLNWLSATFDWSPTYSPGSKFESISFKDRRGQNRRINVAICYESWFAWLPQYTQTQRIEAICHLAFDGRFNDHPEYVQRMLLAIRLRAIETRTWQIVCSHYRGSALIDPRGKIVKQLGFEEGVLRSDEIGEP